jgi:hypothetical protein
MTPDEFLSDVAAIYARDSTGESFGSGRLIAPGLVLTAGHVVDYPTCGAPMCTGWKICLVRERSERGVWLNPPHDAELVWRGSDNLDLALLRLVGATTLAPTLRPVFAYWGETGSIDKVDAAGFSASLAE